MVGGAYKDLDAGSVGDELLNLGSSLFKSRLRNIRQENGSTLLGKKDGRLKANTTRHIVSCVKGGEESRHLPGSTSDDGVLAGKATTGLRICDGRHFEEK